MLELTCPHCQTQFAGEDKATNTCPECNALFFTSDAQAIELGESRKEKPKLKRDDIKPPDKMLVDFNEKGMVITWSWFGWFLIPLLLFTLIWNGVLWSVFVPAILEGGFSDFPIVVFPFFLLVPGIHFLVGFGLLYACLMMLFNKTRVIISEHKIITQTKPIPVWNGYKEFYADEIEQIYVKQNTTRSKNGTSYTYDVFVLKYGAEKPEALLHTLDNALYALFLEQEIESYLGIADRHVGGEYKR